MHTHCLNLERKILMYLHIVSILFFDFFCHPGKDCKMLNRVSSHDIYLHFIYITFHANSLSALVFL